MRRWILTACLLWAVPLATQADTIKPVLNQVMYQTSSEAWVSTQTAEVVISVNATLDENQLAQAHSNILEKLNNIAKADWHITQFNRSPNDSGLEQLQILAQSRLPETALSDLREIAKKVSKPGETFKVDSITFDPTLAETESVRKQLRDEIYQKVQAEITELNKFYPNQHYQVHTINFMENVQAFAAAPRPRAMMMMAENIPNASSAPAVTVANKMTVTASVVLASVEYAR
jgi:hypothetical protein